MSSFNFRSVLKLLSCLTFLSLYKIYFSDLIHSLFSWEHSYVFSPSSTVNVRWVSGLSRPETSDYFYVSREVRLEMSIVPILREVKGPRDRCGSYRPS